MMVRSTSPHSVTVMLLEAAAQKLSIPDLFRVLDKKLGEECSRPSPLSLSAASLESEVC